MITIQTGDDAYRLIGPEGEEGELVEYGLPAVVDCNNGCRYMCFVEDPDDASSEQLGLHVYQLVPAEGTVEEVDFEGDEEEELEEGEEGEEEEEEEELPE